MAYERLAVSQAELLEVILLGRFRLLLLRALSLDCEEIAVRAPDDVGGPLLLKGTPVSPDAVHPVDGVQCGHHTTDYVRLIRHGGTSVSALQRAWP